jgi:hypothetical protein
MTREQLVEREKQKIQIAARVAALKRLANETSTAFRNAQANLSDQLATMIEGGAEYYHPPRKR